MLVYFFVVLFWVVVFGSLAYFLFRDSKPSAYVPKTRWQKQSPYFQPDPFLTE